ncbi:MAG TPA: DUF3501 family protein [Mycobacteriales bacterium]|nr:DUF3501 family protein [Mycobacteriales bacterium]
MLTHDDLVLDPALYAEERPQRRARAIAHKRTRRVPVGDLVTLLFEDRETLLFQTQEMVYAERITDPAAVQAELDTYNPLLPSSHELSATLFIEIPDMATLKAELPRLVGIENSVSLQIGGEVVRALGEEGRSRADYTSTVHYLRFPLTDDQRDAFRDPEVPVELSVDHESYSEATPISGDVRRSLIRDLALD